MRMFPHMQHDFKEKDMNNFINLLYQRSLGTILFVPFGDIKGKQFSGFTPTWVSYLNKSLKRCIRCNRMYLSWEKTSKFSF